MGLKDVAKMYRLQNNLNQKSMAATVGCSQATYCKFEAGTQRLREQYLMRIIKVVIPETVSQLEAREVEAELYLTGRDNRGKLIKEKQKKGKSICLDY